MTLFHNFMSTLTLHLKACSPLSSVKLLLQTMFNVLKIVGVCTCICQVSVTDNICQNGKGQKCFDVTVRRGVNFMQLPFCVFYGVKNMQTC